MIDHRTLIHGPLIERDAETTELAAEIRAKLWLRDNVQAEDKTGYVDPCIDQLKSMSLSGATLEPLP